MPCWQYLDINMQAYVPLQWAEDLSQMLQLSHDRLDYFDQPVHLVGFSMGAYIAALTALQAPAKVASLTLIGNNAQALPEAELAQRKLLLAAIAQGKFSGLSDKQIGLLFHPAHQQQADYIAQIRAMEQDLGMATFAHQVKATSERQNLLSQLALCPFPIHFVTGAADHLATAEQLRQAQHKLKGSSLKLFDDAGHMLPLEQPQGLAEHLARLLK